MIPRGDCAARACGRSASRRAARSPGLAVSRLPRPTCSGATSARLGLALRSSRPARVGASA
eukprot:3727137-Alexandrium_andersonii.AAC.1